MKSSSLWHDIKAHPLILISVIGLHFVVIVLLSINLIGSEVPEPSASPKKTIKAVVVDSDKIKTEAKQAEEKKKQLQAQKAQAKKEADKARKKKEAEKKKQAELKKKQVAEKKRKAELKKKKEAEQKKIAAEKKRAEDERKRVEAEKQKKIAEQKRLAELEKQRKQEEAEELRRKLEEEERLEAEAIQLAEHNKMLDSLRAQYVKLIEQKVERNWIRPANSTADMSCEVIVTQTSLGDVMSVGLQRCANDLAFQRSIERAVRKASPLPPPPNPEVFDREIHFTFKPGS